MTNSPERFLGDLIKDINKDLSPRELDYDSKDKTDYKTFSEKKISFDSNYSFNSFSSFLSFEDNKLSSKNKFSSIITLNQSSILSAFNNQRNTIILQKSLMEASKETIDNIIKEMSGTFGKIIKNKNGNYFCSDLFKVCEQNQRIIILNEISNLICDDCIDEFGTHPIQTLIELSKSQEEYKLILSSFNNNDKILKASLNSNGFFVIQKIMVHIPERYRMEFNMKFIKYLSVLSMDMYGVCTVKKFISYTKNELLVKQILNIILTNFVNISQNQYGNYLIQFILEDWWNTNEGIFLKKLCISKFHILASNHFSLYICDLFIKLSNNEEKQQLISSLNKDNEIIHLKNNKNGNIIINKLMNSLKNQNLNNVKKNNFPLSLNNIKVFTPKKNNNQKI